MASRPKVCLGVSYGHGDSSAALVVDGQLVAGCEEERLTRIKHDASFPIRSIEYCLKHAGLRGSDVTWVAVARKPTAHFWQKLRLMFKMPRLSGRPRADRPISLQRELRRIGVTRTKLMRVEHHYAHMMSARVLSAENDPALLSVDGLGDLVSVAFGRASGLDVEILDRIFFPNSLGFFYTAVTQYLGFPHYGDEFKVMGLSSYGEDTHAQAMRVLVRECPNGRFELNPEAFPLLSRPPRLYVQNRQPKIDPFINFPFFTHMLGVRPRKPTDPIEKAHRDVAHSTQRRFEELANRLLGHLHELVGGTTICLSGGCAHNSVWVGKIPRRTPYQNIHVAPASHDAGLAVGAAIAASRHEVSVEHNHWALIGPSVDELETASEPPTRTLNERELIAWMVERLAQGKIIGLCRGRLEFGPRALGSRSILADPRRAEMKRTLNDRVKHREPFRPFAASVLSEYQPVWFKDSFESPAMEAVFEVEDAVKGKVAAVVHADGTCRIQTVRKETQPFYWKLIEAFRKKTGVPMLLNTSFNDSEPIVCSAEDAMRCFKTTELDALVIEDAVYEKSAESISQAG